MTTQKSQAGQKGNGQTFKNPFFAFDVAKVMEAFDPAKFADEFAKMTDRYKVPGLDMEAMAESHRRNIEALTAANRAAQDGVRKLAKRQGEILEETLAATKAAFEQIGKAGTPQEAAIKQAAIAKDAFEAAIANSQELTELAAKTNADAADVIAGRISEGLDELKALAEQMQR